MKKTDLAILGAGNIGCAVAAGITAAGLIPAGRIVLTRRHAEPLADLTASGYQVQTDNRDAVRRARRVVLAVEPQQLDHLLTEIAPELDPDRHLIISVVTGAGIASIRRMVGQPGLDVVRAMPNTAISLGRSMTCLAANTRDAAAVDEAVSLFDAVGECLVIDEELMGAATALCACGVAFFLRAVRAASQGGIEIGFHPEDALRLAAQTALGAASLVLEGSYHPEREIDRVTTPRGCTIAGLNEMEHAGFSSAMIRGLLVSARKAGGLYEPPADG